MSDTAIEWTDKVWNPVTGCTAVSAGCAHCYAKAMHERFNTRPFSEVVLHPERLSVPLHWRKPRRVFVNSMSDLFHRDVPDHFIAAVFAIMASTPRHTYQVLTKRPERAAAWFASAAGSPWKVLTDGVVLHVMVEGVGWCNPSWPLPNVWMGTSAEDRATAEKRLPHLENIPAAVRFVSAEPLLGPIDFDRIPRALFDREASIRRMVHGPAALNRDQADATIAHPFVDWVIVGGESGPKARPMHPNWVRGIRDQCQVAGVPFFFKQWGAWAPRDRSKADAARSLSRHYWDDGTMMVRVGKKRAGRLLDGRTHMEYPEV